MSEGATTEQKLAAASAMLAALEAMLETSGHMSPFGNKASVANVRKAGKHMEARKAAEAAITAAKAAGIETES